MNRTRISAWLKIGIIGGLVLGSGREARAQFTNNSQTNSFGGVVSNWVGSAYVCGSNTYLDTLIIQSNGVLSNGAGYVGYETSGSNNTVIVRDTGSAWTNQADLLVGFKGAGNKLVVTNGAHVFSAAGLIGMFPSASNNTAIVTGSNSLWKMTGELNIGSNAANNTLIINNGGQVVDAGASVSTDAGGGFNVSVLVTGTNSGWSTSNSVIVSVASAGTVITVANGARFFGGGTVQLGRSAGANGNVVLVTGAGSSWTNIGILQVSAFGSFTQFIVSNSAAAYSGSAVIGGNLNMISNVVMVTGPGSVWTVGGSITVSDSGLNNFLIATNGGLINAQDEFVATSADSSGALIVAGGTNRVFNSLQLGQFGGTGTVTVTSGALFVTNATGTAQTIVNANCTLALGAGKFKADNLIVTNGGLVRYLQPYQLDNGSLTVAGANAQAGSNFTVASTANSTGSVTVIGGGQLVATNGVFGFGNDGTLTNGTGVGLMDIYPTSSVLAVTIYLGSSAGGHGDVVIHPNALLRMICPGGPNCVLAANDVTVDGGILDMSQSTLECGLAKAGSATMISGIMTCLTVVVGHDNTGTLTILDGAMAVPSVLTIGLQSTATGTVWMSNGQCVMTNQTTQVGAGGVARLIVSNGTLSASRMFVSNSANPGTLTILGGIVSLSSNLEIGASSLATGTVWVSGGQLLVTNATLAVGTNGVGQLIASNGLIQAKQIIIGGTSGTQRKLTLAGGFISVGNLCLTNAVGRLDFQRGELSAASITASNGQPFVVGDGSGSAILDLVGSVDSFKNGLQVGLGGWVGGCGQITGTVVIATGGVVEADCGVLAISGSVTNFGTLRARNGATLNVSGSVVNHGILDIISGTTNFPGGFSNTGTILTATGDSDGDGLNNLQEQLAGTDPLNSSSTFRITGVTRAGPDMVVSWTCGAGRTNVVQLCGTGANYATNCVDLSGQIIVVGSGLVSTNYPHTGGATGASNRFYRVRLVP